MILFIGLYVLADTLINIAFASTAGGLRYRSGAAFGSFKKHASHFLNPDCIGTEPKEAPNPVTGESGRLRMEG